uniref:RNase H type-1 domain-containing protein n=1 Tax=Brassica oleracea var. oleracea TaxID=109376 RepID=A0A0D3AJN9_BRAOL
MATSPTSSITSLCLILHVNRCYHKGNCSSKGMAQRPEQGRKQGEDPTSTDNCAITQLCHTNRCSLEWCNQEFRDRMDHQANRGNSALAMREAVKKSKELGLQQVIFQSDSAQLIKALNATVEPTEFYGIVADIRISCPHFEFSTFCWIPRGKNSEADRLAKQALCVVSGGSTT